MAYDFSVLGNGWNREFFYTQGDAFEAFQCPGGGLLVAEVLRSNGFPAAPTAVPGQAMTEHIALEQHAGGGYSAGHRFGMTLGSTQIAGHSSDSGTVAVVYDAGFGDLGLSDDVLLRSERILWASERRLPPQQAFGALKPYTMLLLTADLLRANGAPISRHASWERSAADLVWQLRNNPALAGLLGVPDILVAFAEDGLVHIRQADGRMRATLTLLPGGSEGLLRRESGMEVPDSWAAMVAAAAKELLASGKSKAQGEGFDDAALLLPMPRLMAGGYMPGLMKRHDFRAWLQPADKAQATAFPVPVLPDTEPDPGFWRLAAAFEGPGLEAAAAEYVLQGTGALADLPRFSCGAFSAVDRREIEAYEDVRGLVAAYAQAPDTLPLAIGVFGDPGPGQAFGIEQCALAAAPATAETLRFNVAAMTCENDLAAAFRRVRDSALGGRLPVAVFSGFDAGRDGRPLGWLAGFLAPLQNGTFTDADGVCPLGRCVLVFAATAAKSPKALCRPHARHGQAENAATAAQASAFTAGLRATLALPGPNRQPREGLGFVLRRAQALRSLLERRFGAAGPMPLDPGLLRALLFVKRYRHGTRSLEALLDLALAAGSGCAVAPLPVPVRLAAHVDAGAFARLAQPEAAFNAACEALAAAVCAKAAVGATGSTGEKAPSPQAAAAGRAAWEKLDAEARAGYRAQADGIARELLTVGCGFDAGEAPYRTLKALTAKEASRLARKRHERWVDGMADDGWAFAAERDDAAKLHPFLVAWKELPQAQRQQAVDAVQGIIPLLHAAGLRAYRLG